jgi:hypothetical protein
MCVGGLLGLFDTVLVTKIFVGYIVLDTLWIMILPSRASLQHNTSPHIHIT